MPRRQLVEERGRVTVTATSASAIVNTYVHLHTNLYSAKNRENESELSAVKASSTIENGSVPKIIINDTIGSFFTARCYASAVLAMALCPSVRPSDRPSVRHKSVF